MRAVFVMLPVTPWLTVPVTRSTAAAPRLIHPVWVNVTTPAACEHVHVPCVGVGIEHPVYVKPAGIVSVTTTLFAAPPPAAGALFVAVMVYVSACPGAAVATPSDLRQRHVRGGRLGVVGQDSGLTLLDQLVPVGHTVDDAPPTGGRRRDRVAHPGCERPSVVPDGVAGHRSHGSTRRRGGVIGGIARRVVPETGVAVHVEVVERRRCLAGRRVLVEGLAGDRSGVLLEGDLRHADHELVVRPGHAVGVVVVGGRRVVGVGVVVVAHPELPTVLVVTRSTWVQRVGGEHLRAHDVGPTGDRSAERREPHPGLRDTGGSRLVRGPGPRDAGARCRVGEPGSHGGARPVQLELGRVEVPVRLFMRHRRRARHAVLFGAEQVDGDRGAGRPPARHLELDVVVSGPSARDAGRVPVPERDRRVRTVRLDPELVRRRRQLDG